jgi:hypothetical protein
LVSVSSASILYHQTKRKLTFAIKVAYDRDCGKDGPDNSPQPTRYCIEVSVFLSFPYGYLSSVKS